MDDFRESPALRITQQVEARLSQSLIGVDPYATKLLQEQHLDFAVQSEIPLEENSLVVVLVQHRQFGAALSDIEMLNNVVLMDCGKGSFRPQVMTDNKKGVLISVETE